MTDIVERLREGERLAAKLRRNGASYRETTRPCDECGWAEHMAIHHNGDAMLNGRPWAHAYRRDDAKAATPAASSADAAGGSSPAEQG